MMEEKRSAKLLAIARNRQPDITVVLENVHDSHNIGAVMRSCDSIGIQEVFLLNTVHIPKKNIILGKRTSSGTKKWLDVYLFTDREALFKELRQRCKRVLATHLGEDAVSLYKLDLTQPTALVFGNERDGITKETLSLCDGNFHIPQYGFVQSLNISVSCAVSLYEALRQREKAEFYAGKSRQNEEAAQELMAKYEKIHNAKYQRKRPEEK